MVNNDDNNSEYDVQSYECGRYDARIMAVIIIVIVIIALFATERLF
jgi:hypothetical protein